MKHEWCLDTDKESYETRDFNMMFHNTEIFEYPPLDFQNPKRPLCTGVILQNVSVNEENRPFLMYIPDNFPISGSGVFLYPDNDVTVQEFFEDSIFRKIADQQNIALIILQSQIGGWNQKDIQKEVNYSEAVFKKAISRVYFSINESSYYIMGIGAGAYPAMTYGLLNSSVFACVLADGNYQLNSRLLNQLNTIHSDHNNNKSKLDIMLPAWLVDRTEQEQDTILNILLHANKLKHFKLYNKYAEVYQQDMTQYFNSLDTLPIAEVRKTTNEMAATIVTDTLYKQMILFALQFKRWMGIGDGDIRPTRNYKDMNLHHKTMIIDNKTREWYVYEPSAYKMNLKKKRPVVLAIHGYSCTGEIFAESSNWHEVAESRDFFVIYLSAFPSNLHFNSKTVPLPTWNSIGMVAESDDVAYITEVLKDIETSYPIDSERIYVTGHSNGALMTQTLMDKMPLKFAAFAPMGAQFHINLTNTPKDNLNDIPSDCISRPVWLMMGDEDIGVGSSLEPELDNDLFIKMMCRVNQIDRNHEQYLENGKYKTFTYVDNQQVPLLKFTGVKDLPHTYTPEISYMFWDQFFCHFRRKADGSVEYTQ